VTEKIPRVPGLIESIYEKCLLRELSLHELTAVNQRIVKVEYKELFSRNGMIFW